MLKLFGIPNCNTVKNARLWLDTRGVVFVFHDFKKNGVSPELLDEWLKQVSWDKLVNRAGMTWRGLSDDTKAQITDPTSAKALMLEKPSVIKRPVLVKDDNIIQLGFNEATYQIAFPK